MKHRIGTFKKASFLIAIILILGCGEIPPFVDFSEPILLARDTTYLTNVFPQNVKKNVLIEDISGVKCNNCPKAAKVAHDIQDKFPNRVVLLTLHINGFPLLTAPFKDSKDTFNSEVSDNIVNYLTGLPGALPAGSIDRKMFAGETGKVEIVYQTWETKVVQQLQDEPKAELELSVFKQQGRKVVANVKTTFLEDDATPTYLSVFITESGIKSKQKMPDGTFNYDYEHNSILRDAITHYAGLKLADNVEVGRVFEKGFEFEIPEKYVMDNCSIVVLVNKNDKESTEVLQCIEKPIE